MPDVLHLDVAAAGLSPQSVVDATVAHLRREAEVGTYVAEAEVAEELDRLRVDLAALHGVDPAGVAVLGNASAARAALVAASRLGSGHRIAVLPNEWGPNLETFTGAGLEPVLLPVHEGGLLDLEALPAALERLRPDVVHLTRVAAHRSLVQPVAEAVVVCHDAGVSVWCDAAQAVGHVSVDTGADASYGTSRKWLRGPRGAGWLAVRREHRGTWDLPEGLEPSSVPPAAKLGLGVAVRELVAGDPAQVYDALHSTGRRTAARLADVPGWSVLPHLGGAVTALRPEAGQDVQEVAGRLWLDHRIVVTPCLVWRSPEMRGAQGLGALLRVSPFHDVTDADLDRLAAALRTR